jgi:hypothetical protein
MRFPSTPAAGSPLASAMLAARTRAGAAIGTAPIGRVRPLAAALRSPTTA